MRKLSIVLLIILFLASSCALTCHRGSNIKGSDIRQMEPFENIILQSQIDVYIRTNVGNIYTVNITGDDNLLSLLKTRVENNTLIIGDNQTCVLPRMGLRVYAHMADVGNLSVLVNGGTITYGRRTVEYLVPGNTTNTLANQTGAPGNETD